MADELLTYQDAYEHLLEAMELTKREEFRVISSTRRAISEAYRKLPSLRNWNYHRREFQINVEAAYDTGTVEYDASTRELTLTGGTWPSNAIYGMVTIDDVRYRVVRRVSASVVELDEVLSPSANIAAGESYTWQRFRYLLPAYVGDVSSVCDAETYVPLTKTDQFDAFWRSEALRSETFPGLWTLVHSPTHPSRWEFLLSSSDTEARILRMLYETRFTTLAIQEISSGTVSVTDDVATFSGSVLTEDCVGAVLRIGLTGDKPTPRVGSFLEDAGDGEPGFVTRLPEAERIIRERLSATQAVLAYPLDSDVATRGYSISSLVDVNPAGQWEVFLRLCEHQYYVVTNADPKMLATKWYQVQEALRYASIADARGREPDPPTLRTGYRIIEDE